MKTEELLLILAGVGLVLYSAKGKEAKQASGKKPAIVQNNPNSPNPNVTLPDVVSVIDNGIDAAGDVVDIITRIPGTEGDVLQPSGSDNPSFDAGDRIQEAYGSTDMGDYAYHLDDEEELSVAVPQDVPSNPDDYEYSEHDN